jgi:hypothetical protein
VGIHQKQVGPSEFDAWTYPNFDYMGTKGKHTYPWAEDAFYDGLYWAGIFLPDVTVGVNLAKAHI